MRRSSSVAGVAPRFAASLEAFQARDAWTSVFEEPWAADLD